MENNEWLEKRKTKVGASEISTVVRATQSEEEIKEAMGGSAGSYLEETEFKTPYELYHSKKGNLKHRVFSPIMSEFGHKMEKYAEHYLNSFRELKVSCQPQEVIESGIHDMAGYTPDILGEFLESGMLKAREVKNGDKATIEVKTINFFKAKKEEVKDKGLSWQYILQNQYQLWIQNLIDDSYKWGILCWITPVEAQYDNDFYKGKALGFLESKNFEKITDYFDIDFKIYPMFKSLHPMFLSALNKWKAILENDIEPQPDFKRDCKTYNEIFNNPKHIEELKSKAYVKYGSENGYIDSALLEKAENIKDEAYKFYLKCSEFSTLKKEIEIDKAEWNEFFKINSILGVDTVDFSLKNQAAGSGRTVKVNFKNLMEKATGEVAENKF